jgi:hypothetical protein
MGSGRRERIDELGWRSRASVRSARCHCHARYQIGRVGIIFSLAVDDAGPDALVQAGGSRDILQNTWISSQREPRLPSMDTVPGAVMRVGAVSFTVINGAPSRSTWMTTGEVPVTVMASV